MIKNILKIENKYDLLIFILILSIPFYRIINVDLLYINLSITDLLIIFIFSISFKKIIKTKIPIFITIMILLFFLSFCLSTIASINIITSIRSLSSLILNISLFAILISYIKNLEKLNNLINSLILSGAILAFSAFIEGINIFFILNQVDNVTGLFTKRSELVFYLVSGFSLLFMKYINSAKNVTMTLTMWLYILAIIFSQGRTGILVITITYLISIVISKNKFKNIKYIFIASFIGTTFFILIRTFFPVFFEQLYYRYYLTSLRELSNKNGTVGSRIDIIDGALLAFKENPLIGSGPGTSIENSTNFLNSQVFEVGIQTHNTYLSILVDNGIIGLLIFSLILLGGLYKSYSKYITTKSNLFLVVSIGLLTVILNLFVFDALLRTQTWIFIALSYGVLSVNKEELS